MIVVALVAWSLAFLLNAAVWYHIGKRSGSPSMEQKVDLMDLFLTAAADDIQALADEYRGSDTAYRALLRAAELIRPKGAWL